MKNETMRIYPHEKLLSLDSTSGKIALENEKLYPKMVPGLIPEIELEHVGMSVAPRQWRAAVHWLPIFQRRLLSEPRQDLHLRHDLVRRRCWELQLHGRNTCSYTTLSQSCVKNSTFARRHFSADLELQGRNRCSYNTVTLYSMWRAGRYALTT